MLTKLGNISEKKIALFCLLLAIGLIVIGVYAFLSKGEKLSAFSAYGTIIDVQTTQSHTGSDSYLIVKIPEVTGNIRVSQPKNTAILKGSSVEVICSKYTSGRISCRLAKAF